MRHPISGLFALLLSALLPLAPAAAVDWDFATNQPASNYQTKAMQTFAAEVAKVTNNDVKITVHAGGALGFKGPDMLAALRDGLVPIGSLLLNQQVGLSPILGTSSLPYLVSGFDEMRKFRDVSRPYFDKEFAKYNQKLLYTVPWPGQNVFSKAPIASPDTFRSMKIRTVDRNGSEFFRSLGATPAQIPWGEVVPALATGVIDSVTTSTTSAIDGQFWEFMKNCTVVNWQSNFEGVSVNLDAWNKLKPESRAAIEQAAQRLEGPFWDIAKDEDERNFATLKSKGMAIAPVLPAVQEFMIAKGKASWVAFAKDVPSAKPLIDQYLSAAGK